MLFETGLSCPSVMAVAIVVSQYRFNTIGLVAQIFQNRVMSSQCLLDISLLAVF